MSAQEYNRQQLEKKRLTDAHIVTLVEFWQRHHDLAVDGYAGDNTLATLNYFGVEHATYYPLVALPDGRKPVITSGFYTENPSRNTPEHRHLGCDFFYPWEDSDPDVPIGDGGAIFKNGKRRWWYPPEGSFPGASVFVAPMDGIVQLAGELQTGYRVRLLGVGARAAGMHLKRLLVGVGDRVVAGQALGIVGDNPNGHDGKHLHFERYPVDRFAPMNPRPWLEGAAYLTPEQFAEINGI